MSLADISKPAVEAALTEHDLIGGEAFLAKYGFANAKKYWLVRDGKRYPSKAIAGAAHKFVDGQNLPLAAKDFSGGDKTVATKLRELGFEIESAGRNPDWTRDELILALDLYFTNPANPPGKETPAVTALSSLLNKLHRLNGVTASDTLRNPNGVYLKMMNFRSADPAYVAQGKVGMTRGNSLEGVLWAEYEGRREALATDAKLIRDAVGAANEIIVTKLPSNEPYEGEEGGIVIRLHRRYERDPKLIAEKKKAAKVVGALICEVCEFDFGKRYGELGSDFIEVHHVKPVFLLKPGARTKLSDLALLCSNCHRMAHRKRIPLSLEELKAALRPLTP